MKSRCQPKMGHPDNQVVTISRSGLGDFSLQTKTLLAGGGGSETPTWCRTA